LPAGNPTSTYTLAAHRNERLTKCREQSGDDGHARNATCFPLDVLRYVPLQAHGRNTP
jgi:hypothetical protein